MDINLSDEGIGEVNLEEGLNSDARKAHARQSEPDLVVDAINGSSNDPIPTVPNADESNVADNKKMDHGSEEPENIVPTTVGQIHPDSASADTYCQSLIASARDKVSAQLAIFEEWTHFCLEVRLKNLSSFESMVDIEEQLLESAETEDITELSERRSPILYKLLEIELEKLYLAHLANFKTCLVSVHHDFECIRRLHQELRLIAAAHRHHRGLVGLPFTTPESDFVPKFSPALEMYGLTSNTIGSALNENPHIEQNENETLNEHQAQENESLIPMSRHDIRTQDGQNSEARADEGLNAIPISVINPDVTIVAMEKTFSHTLMTKHHTAQLHDQLKKTTDEMDIKMNGAAKKGEGGSSSRPREGPSGHGLTGGRGGSSSQRGRSDDPSNRYRYAKWF
ncbi:hypothetical protein F511_35300 [Dorcoceras hygrometricum]|uniref:Uncharacterized protein n=1 Tax=Dorcoceras hygrometricum TaxID=472368 RepID=A0A2Z7C221_9LAMI|nr:hypothetical protein F511_35300 [Dorcoceras hygrometricum]